ncbi:histidinol dehydrogenase [Clostridium acetobutylicum]|uniref:Histidinol dehydrogenase n=1 Tax=Clostridium acetobutylicum (strain ATCC 824 / DSM 792 / JCM 1419 / IAM 19013 / LMG 5710 / NBRC 13948 / NRRL B-527 / VKM B-1787 / 2291 / W) TaxID=272562 RepID=HISX_CLOAB|nr:MULTISPECIES: histidinol dehydrogenase [Clostridium]Q97KI2.1 RecName: Full=Histidinol dehydrogenase; Short=HDH [Clostridium acetobutylicum ATCC 824]AAK78913.1 Histidinol dehydrogenase [Clostridium acetobutylicum ATCC 824]ADZ19988.1 Histidinol dehydrogenase [Clostridium acetobutylicum EA 2018]AEI33461.1 histidinol dehydrogenase [Clostridium acetobutylicum DSM 1731]AWV80632.1 histidinol dehydrogenase [Clostridium acetobutylicum]MBC2392822.1 histidinol dehydrogenase [Clostridium acetobutylicu
MEDIIRIIQDGSLDGEKYFQSLKERQGKENAEIIKTVKFIIDNVKENGDKALIEYTSKFDKVELQSIEVTKEEIKAAYSKVENDFICALKTAKENIEEYHSKQVQNSYVITKENGIVMGRTVRGLDKVGIYVPGGTAAYPSSVIMNAVPAKVAGVNKIIMTTPPMKDGFVNPSILVAADLAGVDKIYKVGGAQAIAALAFGTETIDKVDKIVGPGNIFVAMAKKSVYGFVDIDMIAGPSEILVISDETGNPKFIAADLMSQAEHDTLASSILVTTSKELIGKVIEEIKLQVEGLSRKEIILEALRNFGAIILVDSISRAIEIGNVVAPEHLEIITPNPFEYLNDIKNAGSIFLGSYSPEPLGDYMAGPNHVLPTSGTARFSSPLSVDDFVKKSSYLYYSEKALRNVNDKVVKIAETEGLTAHANSIKVRFK